MLANIFSVCAKLNPDPFEEDEEGQGWVFSADQMVDEARENEDSEWDFSHNPVSSIENSVEATLRAIYIGSITINLHGSNVFQPLKLNWFLVLPLIKPISVQLRTEILGVDTTEVTVLEAAET
ncbi:hypothetical protein SLE2022_023190 [Rubroshorea leprosula]